jgi:hypothetical protein
VTIKPLRDSGEQITLTEAELINRLRDLLEH